MSKVVRLAQLLELKHGLQSRAAEISEDRIVKEVKQGVLDAYRNYFSRSARDSMFQYAADLREPKSSELVYKMDKLVKDIDELNPQKLIRALNEIVGLMHQMKTDPEKSVRTAIHNSVPSGTEAQRNTRQRLLTKYERSISMAFPALQKLAIKLQVLAPDVEINREDLSHQNTRAELSKQQLINFVLATPAFKQHGVDDFAVMEEVLADPEMKQRLTTLINAVQRGRLPIDGLPVQEFALGIKKMLEQRKQTNLPQLEELEGFQPEKVE